MTASRGTGSGLRRRAAHQTTGPRLRIVAGELAGRRLAAAPASRPTQEKVRAAVMSRWQGRLIGCRFADLFCGGGAMGIEAWSRGAGDVVLVDHDLTTVVRNLGVLFGEQRPANLRAVRAILPGGARGPDAGSTPPWAGTGFDLIYADPPYSIRDWPALLDAVGALLASRGDEAEIGFEHGVGGQQPDQALPERAGSLARVDVRRYGQSAVSYYRRL